MAPTVLFVAAFFVAPIGLFLLRSVDNAEIAESLPMTIKALEQWNREGLPEEEAFAAIYSDLRAIGPTPDLTYLARRLNYNIPGYRSLIMKTGRKEMDLSSGSYQQALTNLDERWGESAYWIAIKNQDSRFTTYYLLNALDLRLDAAGEFEAVDADSAVFLELYGRTFWISGIVTLLCLIVAYPVASLMASVKPATASVLFMAVLIPFWTSLLVRTTAWVILLQNEGLVNQTLIGLGILSEPARLIFNRMGVYIAMVHVLLPYMILPLYSILKGISKDHLRAASSLGAKPLTVFLRIYVPLSAPGIAAGCTLVFVLAVGFYITPALVGGPGDQMVGYFIAYFTNSAVNWGMASALGALTLLTIGLMYVILAKTVGIHRLKVR
jgi:putative spermidine/putrescine transport system permease protein